MPTTYRILGQGLLTANTFTDLYRVPIGSNTIVSTVNVCNTSTSNTTFRLLARPNGNTTATGQYLAFNVPVGIFDATAISVGMTLGANDVVTAFSFEGNAAVTVFGTEIN
jgi:hypothetical protein